MKNNEGTWLVITSHQRYPGTSLWSQYHSVLILNFNEKHKCSAERVVSQSAGQQGEEGEGGDGRGQMEVLQVVNNVGNYQDKETKLTSRWSSPSLLSPLNISRVR